MYDELASVYEFLVPDALLEPEGAAAAFAGGGPRRRARGGGALVGPRSPGGASASTPSSASATRSPTPPGAHSGARRSPRWPGCSAPAGCWSLAGGWDEPHGLEVAVALLEDDGSVTTHGELLAFWPFTEPELRADLLAAGLEPEAGTYEPDAERYLLSARRPGGDGGAARPRPTG